MYKRNENKKLKQNKLEVDSKPIGECLRLNARTYVYTDGQTIWEHNTGSIYRMGKGNKYIKLKSRRTLQDTDRQTERHTQRDTSTQTVLCRARVQVCACDDVLTQSHDESLTTGVTTTYKYAHVYSPYTAASTYTRLTALCPGLPWWAGTRKVKTSGFYWSKRQWVAVASAGPYMQVCTLLQTDNHASTPPLGFYRPDAFPAAQPTASQHWRHCCQSLTQNNLTV